MMNTFSLLLITQLFLATGIEDYFRMFPHKPENFSAVKEDEHTRIKIDEKNAYLMISYDDADYSFEYGGEIEFTYFVKEDKQKIFGYSEFFDGPSSSSSDTKYYTYTNQQWREISPLPDLKLEDFSTSELVEKVGTEYHIRYQLPQHGTDIIASVYPVGENNTPFDYSSYSEFINGLPQLTLSFQKKSGQFVVKK